VTPSFDVVSIEYRQAPVGLTQLPPGAVRARPEGFRAAPAFDVKGRGPHRTGDDPRFPGRSRLGPFPMDPEFVAQFLQTIDCYVMGSRTYETALEFEAKGFGFETAFTR
jgi:hypothetical protein